MSQLSSPPKGQQISLSRSIVLTLRDVTSLALLLGIRSSLAREAARLGNLAAAEVQSVKKQLTSVQRAAKKQGLDCHIDVNGEEIWRPVGMGSGPKAWDPNPRRCARLHFRQWHLCSVTKGESGIFGAAYLSAICGGAPLHHGPYLLCSVPTATGMGLTGSSPTRT